MQWESVIKEIHAYILYQHFLFAVRTKTEERNQYQQYDTNLMSIATETN